MSNGRCARCILFLILVEIAPVVALASPEAIDGDVDGYPNDVDCNDQDPRIYPDAEELCNLVDDNCDGQVDEGVTTSSHLDRDGDGFGEAAAQVACEVPEGALSDASDCDDRNSAINPAATEICDGLDNNCDGAVDDNETNAPTWYADADADGYGTGGTVLSRCIPADGYIGKDGDCNDGNPAVHADAAEICDTLDNDCDGQVDEDAVDPATFYADADHDGYGNVQVSIKACRAPQGHVGDKSDCNDADRSIFPGATELCDDKDNDCDGAIDETVLVRYYQDEDSDGVGGTVLTEACTAPIGYGTSTGDCNDADRTVSPLAKEVHDGKDNDCDGEID